MSSSFTGENNTSPCVFASNPGFLFTHTRPHTHIHPPTCSYTSTETKSPQIRLGLQRCPASRGQSSSLQHTPDSYGIHIECYSKQTSKRPACSTFICSDCSCLKERGETFVSRPTREKKHWFFNTAAVRLARSDISANCPRNAIFHSKINRNNKKLWYFCLHKMKPI